MTAPTNDVVMREHSKICAVCNADQPREWFRIDGPAGATSEYDTCKGCREAELAKQAAFPFRYGFDPNERGGLDAAPRT